MYSVIFSVQMMVMKFCIAGISDPSAPSEEVMVGAAPDDELFDLPSYSRGRSSSRLGRRFKMPSMERGTAGAGGVNRRHTSLDREVYYDSDNVRQEMVNYKPMDTKTNDDSKLGTLTNKYKLSNEEMTKYKTSMSQLCHKMKAISNNSLVAQKPASNDATQPLKREILSQARKYNSSSLLASNKAHLDQASQPKSSSSTSDIVGDVTDCKKSLSDIRDRIGSLQSLLKQSRTLTNSRQHLVSDNIARINTNTLISSPAEAAKKENFASHRNDSYSRAMDNDSEQIQVRLMLDNQF